MVLRSLPDFEAVHKMIGHRGSIRSVAFSADEGRLLSVGGDGTVAFWNSKTGGAPLARLRFLADGEWFLEATDGRWDASPKADAQCGWSVASAKDGLNVLPLSAFAERRVVGLLAKLLAKQ